MGQFLLQNAKVTYGLPAWPV